MSPVNVSREEFFIKKIALASVLIFVVLALAVGNMVHAAQIVATIPVGNAPTAIAYDFGKGEIFVANAGGPVSVISDSTNLVVANVEVADSGGWPMSSDCLAYDSAMGEIFATNGARIAVISDTTDTIIANVSVPTNTCPYAAAYDSNKSEIFATTFGGNTILVISDTNNAVIQTINTAMDTCPDGCAYDSAKNEIFVANYGDNGNSVSVISDASPTPSPSPTASPTPSQTPTPTLTPSQTPITTPTIPELSWLITVPLLVAILCVSIIFIKLRKTGR